MRDKPRLILGIALVLSLGFAVMAAVNYHVSRNALRHAILAAELPLTIDHLYAEIRKELARPVFVASMMATDTFLRDWVLEGEREEERVIRYLTEIQRRHRSTESFFVSERSRKYYDPNGVLKNVRDGTSRDRWYFRLRELPQDFEINLDHDMAHQDALTIFINHRVTDYGGNFLGAAGVGFSVASLNTLMERYQEHYGRGIYFVDLQGVILLTARKPAVEGQNIHDVEGLGALASTILGSSDGTYEYRRDGTNHLLNVRFLPELNWYLFVEKEEDAALSPLRRTLYLNLAVCVVVTTLVLAAVTWTLNRYQERLEIMATTDKLTGLTNRQAFEPLMARALDRARREGSPVTALMADIDKFKDVNDRWGHLAGDETLRHIAQIFRETLGDGALICRWGGEEFLVLLPGHDRHQGELRGEALRRAVEERPASFGNDQIVLSVSVGVTPFGAEDSEEKLLGRVDRALYLAKGAGRNQVAVLP